MFILFNVLYISVCSINEDNNNIITSHQAAFESNTSTTHNQSTLQQETYESTYDSENTSYDTSDKEIMKIFLSYISFE